MMVNSILRLFHVFWVTCIFLVHCVGKNEEERAHLLRTSIERLGAIYVKLGQFLSERSDLLSRPYRAELERLLENVEPVPWERVKPLFVEQYGCEPHEYFDSFDTEVAASASFAQTYRAQKDGKDLLVKIKRPHIERLAHADTVLVSFVLAVIDVLTRRRHQLSEIVRELRDWAVHELDYRQEIRNQKAIRTIARRLVFSNVIIPDIYEEQSREHVLVMDYIDGISISAFIRNGNKNNPLFREAGEIIAREISSFFLETAHVHGHFHADPHLSNMLITLDGNVAIIDFGMVGVLTPKQRTTILQYVRSLARGNLDVSFDILLSLSSPHGIVNYESVRKEYTALNNLYCRNVTIKDHFDHQAVHGPVFARVVHLFQKNNMYLPMGLLRYLKAFHTIEGPICRLYPDFSFSDIADTYERVGYYNAYALLREKQKAFRSSKHIPDEVLVSVENFLTSV